MNELTNEQLTEEILKTRAERQSYYFMKRHVADFVPCQANSDVLTRYMQEHDLEWNQENLEIAFDNCKDQLAVSDVPKLAPVNTAGPLDGLPPSPPGVTWPSTKSEIHLMDRGAYSREFHNLKTGSAFRARINFILSRGL